MYDELTEVDIQKMKDEIEERKALAPKLREAVKEAKALGDLSENDEYKSAKRELNKNNSRIRYLTNMISTAKIIKVESKEDEVGLFDTVEVYYPDDDETEKVRIVTTLRNDVFSNNISKESPFGKAILGAKAGQTVTVYLENNRSYEVKIVSIEKGEDDPNLEIRKY